jgi:hypothetical protein
MWLLFDTKFRPALVVMILFFSYDENKMKSVHIERVND